jgi:crotonobetainyl-CoA:carnitine CoA-transferase CaiB-like acyl-CoA transferase
MELTGNRTWGQMEMFANAQERARNWDALEPLVLEWTMNHTGAEIAELAQGQGVPCFPAYSVGEMVNSEHVAARDFMWDLEGPGGQKFQLPGYPVRMEATPWRLRRPAPRLGEHNAQVIGEWLEGK